MRKSQSFTMPTLLQTQRATSQLKIRLGAVRTLNDKKTDNKAFVRFRSALILSFDFEDSVKNRYVPYNSLGRGPLYYPF